VELHVLGFSVIMVFPGMSFICLLFNISSMAMELSGRSRK